MIVPLSDIRPGTAFQQYSDSPLFQVPNEGIQTDIMPFPIPAPLTSSFEPDYAPVTLQQQSLYNVAVPCSNGVGTQLPLVMHLPQSQGPIPVQVPQTNGLTYYAFDGENKQPEFVPVLQPEFIPINGQRRGFYNVAVPFSQNTGSHLSFLIQSPQNYMKDQIHCRQLITSNFTVQKGSKSNLPCVPTVRIAQNSQFTNVQHRNLISLTATPPTTSGSLPRPRGRHTTNQDIHNTFSSNHVGKARRVLNPDNVNNLENLKPNKELDNQKLLSSSVKSPRFSRTEARREADVKRQDQDTQREYSFKRNITSTRSNDTINTLSLRRFTGARSYFPEEGSSPLTAMLHCGFCYANNEPEEVFRSHNTHDEVGITICPKLRQVVCSYCKATGDRAHTAGFCPNRRDGNNRSPIVKASSAFAVAPFGRLKKSVKRE